jgi:7,8-dihydro-6-hydroxymethylpterin-pyrophosphokinase
VRAYLGLGSNLGDRGGLLQQAVDGLARFPDVTVVAVSPVY